MQDKTAPNSSDVPLIDRPVVLVGMMGVGKTTIGKLLATRLFIPFYDSDDEIVHREGVSVADIFAEKGEPYFREIESRVIGNLLDQGRCVLSTGGGAMTIPSTAEAILKKSVSLWLDAAPGVLARRTEGSDRPLLKQGNPSEILRALAEKREPFYAKANMRIATDEGSPAEIVERIVSSLVKAKDLTP